MISSSPKDLKASRRDEEEEENHLNVYSSTTRSASFESAVFYVIQFTYGRYDNDDTGSTLRHAQIALSLIIDYLYSDFGKANKFCK